MGRFYITTPIYYANDAPHVGSAYTTVNADAMARWHRLVGDETKFLTGTDEHGQKVADAAAKNHMTPQDWTSLKSEQFKEAWETLNISFDDFIRTSEPRHYLTVQKFLSAIYDNGYIYKDVYKGLYCVSCEDYYTIETSVEGKCPIHGRALIEMEEENWFFRLSAFEERLEQHYAQHPGFVTPETKRNEALSFIKGGLRDISITRTSISWGVPVPWDEAHVFYVWYDALINYLTAIGYGSDHDEVATWWPYSHHLIGKEIIRFHCVWWPAMCMAAGIEPVQSRTGARVALVGRSETQQDDGRRRRRQHHRHRAGRTDQRVRRRSASLLLAARDVTRQRRRVLPRGDHPALQHRPGEQSRESRRAGHDGRRVQVRRCRTASDGQLLAARARRQRAACDGDGVERLLAPESARSDVGSDRGDQRVPGRYTRRGRWSPVTSSTP